MVMRQTGNADEDALFARLFDLTGDLLCVFDADGVVRSARGHLTALGHPGDELIGNSLFARMHPHDAITTRARLQGMKVGGAPTRFESRCRGRDDSYRWLAWCVAREADDLWSAVLQDATERKWVEHELEASISLVEATLESTADGLLVADKAGHVITFNRRFLELWGISDSVVFAGSNEIDRFCEPMLVDSAEHSGLTRELHEALEAERYEVLTLHDERVFERYSRPRRIGEQIEGRVWSFRDITEPVRAERELREHLSMGIEHAVEGIGRIDADGRFLSANAVLGRMLGYDESELIGSALGSRNHPEGARLVVEACERVPEDGKVEVELHAERQDGRTVLLRALIVRASNREAGFHVFARDITEQKEMQQRLLLTDRMASMGTLAAGVAHEINNPLCFVIANATVLGETLPGLSPVIPSDLYSEITELVGDIQEGAERVRRIVQDLKMFSRPDDTTHGAIDVHKVLESTVNMAFHEIRPRARLVREYGQVTSVDANEGQLGQVFLNLLVNAAHAIPEGETEQNEIRISTSTDAGGQVVVEIRDTGVGIESHVLPRIFDPFFTTKPVGMGTGLGLSVCHGIIVKLGGDIEVESKIGIGTMFRVVLRPAVAPPKGDTVKHAPEPDSGHRSRVLVVDDEAMIGTSLRRILSRHYDVVVCTGGGDALSMLAGQQDFEIILCDLMMPGVTGMDVYEELHKKAPDVARRMVFMTGGIFTPRAKAFLDEVPNHRLDKPIDMPVLLDWMRDALRNTNDDANPPVT